MAQLPFKDLLDMQDRRIENVVTTTSSSSANDATTKNYVDALVNDNSIGGVRVDGNIVRLYSTSDTSAAMGDIANIDLTSLRDFPFFHFTDITNLLAGTSTAGNVPFYTNSIFATVGDASDDPDVESGFATYVLTTIPGTPPNFGDSRTTTLANWDRITTPGASPVIIRLADGTERNAGQSSSSTGTDANDSTITLEAGVGFTVASGGDFTTNQASGETIRFDVDRAGSPNDDSNRLATTGQVHHLIDELELGTDLDNIDTEAATYTYTASASPAINGAASGTGSLIRNSSQNFYNILGLALDFRDDAATDPAVGTRFYLTANGLEPTASNPAVIILERNNEAETQIGSDVFVFDVIQGLQYMIDNNYLGPKPTFGSTRQVADLTGVAVFNNFYTRTTSALSGQSYLQRNADGSYNFAQAEETIRATGTADDTRLATEGAVRAAIDAIPSGGSDTFTRYSSNEHWYRVGGFNGLDTNSGAVSFYPANTVYSSGGVSQNPTSTDISSTALTVGMSYDFLLSDDDTLGTDIVARLNPVRQGNEITVQAGSNGYRLKVISDVTQLDESGNPSGQTEVVAAFMNVRVLELIGTGLIPSQSSTDTLIVTIVDTSGITTNPLTIDGTPWDGSSARSITTGGGGATSIYDLPEVSRPANDLTAHFWGIDGSGNFAYNDVFGQIASATSGTIPVARTAHRTDVRTTGATDDVFVTEQGIREAINAIGSGVDSGNNLPTSGTSAGDGFILLATEGANPPGYYYRNSDNTGWIRNHQDQLDTDDLRKIGALSVMAGATENELTQIAFLDNYNIEAAAGASTTTISAGARFGSGAGDTSLFFGSGVIVVNAGLSGANGFSAGQNLIATVTGTNTRWPAGDYLVTVAAISSDTSVSLEADEVFLITDGVASTTTNNFGSGTLINVGQGAISVTLHAIVMNTVTATGSLNVSTPDGGSFNVNGRPVVTEMNTPQVNAIVTNNIGVGGVSTTASYSSGSNHTVVNIPTTAFNATWRHLVRPNALIAADGTNGPWTRIVQTNLTNGAGSITVEGDFSEPSSNGGFASNTDFHIATDLAHTSQVLGQEWELIEDIANNNITFRHNGVNVMRLSSNGDLITTGNITANGTIT